MANDNIFLDNKEEIIFLTVLELRKKEFASVLEALNKLLKGRQI